MFMERGRAAAGEQQRCQETGQAAEQQRGRGRIPAEPCLAGEHSQAGAAGTAAEGLSRSARAQRRQGGTRIAGGARTIPGD